MKTDWIATSYLYLIQYNMKTCLSRYFCHAAFQAFYTAIQLRKVVGIS